jgi:hypothetical protein
VALVLHVRLNPAESLRKTSMIDDLSPSLRAHMGDFGSAAATKCVNPRGDGPSLFRLKEKRPAGKTPSPRGLEHFVAAALPEIPTRARKLGDGISLTGVAYGHLEGLRCTRSSSAVVPPVRFGRVRQGAFLKVFFSWGPSPPGGSLILWLLPPKTICARPQARRQDLFNWCCAWASGRV